MDLSLLLLVFSLIFTVVSRLLLYGMVDKTSRLKMKSFSTMRDTQRGSQSYMEKLFIFNLDLLSTVLYRRRSLETTVKIRLKTRSRRLKFKP